MTAELAVVGGGIVGCFTAYEAARAGRRVTLLERTAVAAGATAWSAGISFPLGRTPAHRRLVRLAADGYDRLAGTGGAQFLRALRIVYVVRRSGLDEFRERVVGAAVRPVTDEERDGVERLLPGVRIGAEEVLVALDGRGFAVDAGGLAGWLAGQVDVHTGQDITSVTRDGDGYRLTAGDTEWSTDQVVLATGPWTGPRPRSSLRVKRIAALHADLDTGPGDLVVSFVDDDLFFLPRPGDTTLVSFYRDVWDVDPADVDGRADTEDLRQGREAVHRRCPAAAGAITGGRAFCDAYTPGRLPLVTGYGPGLVRVHGGSGSGVRFAPGLATDALALVRTSEHPVAGR
ncbi:hypothetical protein BLA60_02420 [Actinophytocola xinjiangensis]|uniref:FAD dependent oxidoreductase domain-containing protein n=1 Tax=Actinophytocola xinjiangensis TaxID=485602 RepID=A0A7Z1B0R4_9PSEU|nr:FAD-dependent oxidoreductase [Actinophytocola xinjiangensis]OLF14048.1 hypothetical protein BLA60_02420 [Actinophytocola xinjiangensis]